MNEIRKQLLSKIGDTSERKSRVIQHVNANKNPKNQKRNKSPWGYYVTFASFVGIFVIGLFLLPKLMNESGALNEETPSVVDPGTEPNEEKNYYDELKQFFPPDGTIATYDVEDFYSAGSIVTTKWISDRYVLQIDKSVNCPECLPDGKISIYRITDNQIELISDGGDYRTDWTIEELDKLSALTVILKGPIEVGTRFNGMIISDKNASVVTPYGEFKNAVFVEDEDGYDELTGGEYKSDLYFVPGFGIVKSEVNGHHYSSSELASISFGGNEISNENHYNSLLKSYFFPTENSDAYYLGGFENGGEKVQTKWISDEFVQQIRSNGGATVQRIYKIKDNQIDMVYEEMIDEFNPASLSIEELNKLPTMNTIMKAPLKIGEQFDEWKVIDLNGEISTFYSSFTDVLILENQSEDSITRKYYAKGYGEVKLEFEFYNEEIGKYEKSDFNTELSSFGPIMNEVQGNYIFRVFEENDIDINSIDEVKISPMETKRAILHGRGGDFEGINQLVVENLETGKFTIYKYRHEGEQNTPKEIEWIDENRLYVIVGYGFGTVTMGGQLYELNITNHSIKPVFDNLTEKEEIMSVKSNGDGTFTYKKHVYEDDNYSVGHVEEGIISPTTE